MKLEIVDFKALASRVLKLPFITVRGTRSPPETVAASNWSPDTPRLETEIEGT
jgi:hypothetical protein